MKPLIFFSFSFFLLCASSCSMRKSSSGFHDSIFHRLSCDIENSYKSFSPGSETEADLDIESKIEKNEHFQPDSVTLKRKFKKVQAEKTIKTLRAKLKGNLQGMNTSPNFKDKNIVLKIGEIILWIGILLILFTFILLCFSKITSSVFLAAVILGLGFMILSLPFLLIGWIVGI